jgi:hypothetical protein
MAQVEITKGGKRSVTLIAVGTGAATIELNGAGGLASFNSASENVTTLSVKGIAWTANSGAAYWEVRRGGSTGNIVGQFPNVGNWRLDEYKTSLSANNQLNSYNVYVNLIGTGSIGTIVLDCSKDANMNVRVP